MWAILPDDRFRHDIVDDMTLKDIRSHKILVKSLTKYHQLYSTLSVSSVWTEFLESADFSTKPVRSLSVLSLFEVGQLPLFAIPIDLVVLFWHSSLSPLCRVERI